MKREVEGEEMGGMGEGGGEEERGRERGWVRVSRVGVVGGDGGGDGGVVVFVVVVVGFDFGFGFGVVDGVFSRWREGGGEEGWKAPEEGRREFFRREEESKEH